MTPDSLGPLPKGDRGDDLQQQSLLALRNALPTELFLPRDERVDDKGVIHYGDSVPAEYSQREQRELNSQGVEVGRHQAEMTPAEEEFPNQRFLLYVSAVPNSSPLLTALQGAPELFEKLRIVNAFRVELGGIAIPFGERHYTFDPGDFTRSPSRSSTAMQGVGRVLGLRVGNHTYLR